MDSWRFVDESPSCLHISSHILQPHRGGLNPYHLGFAMWSYLYSSIEGPEAPDHRKQTDGRDAFVRLDRELAEALTSQQRLEELKPLVADLPALRAERERLDLLASRVARRRETLGLVSEVRRRVAAIEERLAVLPSSEVVAGLRQELERRRGRRISRARSLGRRCLDVY